MLGVIAAMPLTGGSTVMTELDKATQAALGRVRA
jgi:hypothetical protein